MCSPSRVSIASRVGSSRLSNRRANRLAFMMVFWVAFMHHCGRADAAQMAAIIGQFNSKDALYKATETVCMSNNGKRVAWVTGGGSGIGEAGAESLAGDGWTGGVSGRRKDGLDAGVAKITKCGGKAGAHGVHVNNKAEGN